MQLKQTRSMSGDFSSPKVIDGLKVGNEALKKANEMFSIEEIEQIMGDTAEAVEKQREIEALIGGQLSAEDEEEVLKELDDLAEEKDATLAAASEPEEPAVPLPEVPEDDVPGDESTLPRMCFFFQKKTNPWPYFSKTEPGTAEAEKLSGKQTRVDKGRARVALEAS